MHLDKMDIDGDAEEASRRVQVRFVTKLEPPNKAPPASIAIPTNLTRFGLSALVNNLLKAGNADWKAEAFDSLIDGELVRMSLEEFLLAKGISAEKILEIEYTKAVAPRKEEDPSLHDDWVSAVDGSNPRVWKAAGFCTHLLEGHNDAITSVCILKPNESGIDQVVATASKDRTLKLFKVNTEDSPSQPKKIQAFMSFHGHNASVQCIAADPSGDKVCWGSWDCRIKLWQTRDSDSGGNFVLAKKRKTDSEDEEPKSEGEAISSLVGLTQCVFSVVWPEREAIYSASWDHSIRRWDVETGKDSMNMFCGKVINCLDVGGESSFLIAAGCSDPILRIWDLRKPGCKWHDKSWYHLVSASYDGKVMLWDLRTAWPLAIIDSHEDKVLCADWWRSECVISGGTDSKLCFSSEISVM